MPGRSNKAYGLKGKGSSGTCAHSAWRSAYNASSFWGCRDSRPRTGSIRERLNKPCGLKTKLQPVDQFSSTRARKKMITYMSGTDKIKRTGLNRSTGCNSASRAAETLEHRRTRSEDQRRQQAASRASHFTSMEGKMFQYYPVSSYDSHPQFDIGRMNDVRPYCEAFK